MLGGPLLHRTAVILSCIASQAERASFLQDGAIRSHFTNALAPTMVKREKYAQTLTYSIAKEC